ncbi:MAG: FAD-dependent oxidoreductase [Dongiaceae bacterium]
MSDPGPLPDATRQQPQGLRIAIVGAGPAGIRAAETLVRHGLRPTVIDEAPRSGGQIYRRPPADVGFTRSAVSLYGFEARKAQSLHRAFDALQDRLDYRPGTLVWDIAEGHLHGHRYETGTGFRLAYDALLLATGAMDRVIPIPGWTLPGVFTLGGAQIALKYQGCAIGRRTILLGSGPLLYLVAHQYAKAGAAVAGVLDTAPASAKRRALPTLLASPAQLAKGLLYRAALAARGVAIHEGVRPLRIEETRQQLALHFRDAAGRARWLDGDAVALGWGLRSETQLADLAGCRFGFDRLDRQWLPETDSEGRSSVPGLYLAGDGAGIAGADAAERRGELAALALLADRGFGVPPARMAALRANLEEIRRFRKRLEAAFPFPDELAAAVADDTLLCRCEAITAGVLRASIGGLAAGELNRAKAWSRVGMGRCQGRVCGSAAAEVLAAALGLPVEAVGRLRGQPPVKPIPVSALRTEETA